MDLSLINESNIDEIYNSIILKPGSDILPSDHHEDEFCTPTHHNQFDVVENNELTEATPNGTIKSYTPIVPVDLKPVLNSVWDNPESVVQMYEKYAEQAGFVVRKSSVKHRKDGFVSNRYYLCNKEGKPKKYNSIDTIMNDCPESSRSRRNSSYSITGCEARIKIKNKKGTNFWLLYEFVEKHNHPMIDKNNKHLSKPCRKLLFEDQVFIQNVSTNNIGATKAYRLRAAINGGYENVRGTVVDYKNTKSAINLFVGNRDAQMLVDKFRNMSVCLPKFLFDYKCDKRELVCVFWADETSQCNYKEFGDVIAFDATYKMVFVPFTGVDNHNKCVTFGAGLLKNEDIASYSWLLKAFLKAHTHQPNLVLTDQDPSLKAAVAQEMPESNHRLCMWHIMNKLPCKIDGDQLKNTDLRERLHKLVWNVFLEPEEFESSWNVLIEEFELEDQKWLKDMYGIRDMWIPAFFKHLPLSCLMKTTSRSESSNAFFRLFTHKSHTLVQFMLCFETAMEKQRHAQRVLNDHTATTRPTLVTPLPIETHAAEVYTRTIFFKVQKEIIRGFWPCSFDSVSSDNDSQTFMVKHSNKTGQSHLQFMVTINFKEETIDCKCNLFGRTGYLCRHIFCVLKAKNINKIPEQYITRRWRRDILPHHLLDSRHRYGYKNTEDEKKSSEALAKLELCLSRLRNDPQELSEFVQVLNKMTEDKLSKLPIPDPRKEKEETYKRLLGVIVPEEVDVDPPSGINNKGSGTHIGKRLKHPREAPVNKKRRVVRQCQWCKQVQDVHDQRTCPDKLAHLLAEKEAAAKAKKAAKSTKDVAHSPDTSA
uniref:protein FAR1-RELATED SEQUENCE 5-like n=1 Tax=Erigeron canadensis TaxID=72917 RepID=UPI001CB99706|nr:protein FAR1-RELATED SEQUENCE 5-like [Erigeron canadensis]